MRIPRGRLEDAIAIGDEAERVEFFGFGVDARIFHHGSLGDRDPIPRGDMSPVGERVRPQGAPLDRN